MPMGYAFQPGADTPFGQGGNNGQTGRSVSAPDSSVKVLSFRMPKQDARNAVAPQSLLSAPGGAQAGLGGLSPQILALLMQAFSAGPRGLMGASDGPFSGSSDPAGVTGPSPGLGPSFGPPRFTIGEGDQGPFRLDENLGPGVAAGGPFGGDDLPMGGAPTGFRGPGRSPDQWNTGTGPRYRMEPLGYAPQADVFM